jgi:hypothetical protein
MARTIRRSEWDGKHVHGCRKPKPRRTGTRHGALVRHFEEI